MTQASRFGAMLALVCAAAVLVGCAMRTQAPQPVPVAQLRGYLEVPRAKTPVTVQQQAQRDEALARGSASMQMMGALAQQTLPTEHARQPGPGAASRAPTSSPSNATLDIAAMAALARDSRLAAPAPATMLVPQPTWEMRASDQRVSKTLQRWAAPLGVEVVWETEIDPRITGTALVAQDSSLEHAVLRLLEGLRTSGYPLQATFFGRHALHVREVGPR